MSILLNTLLKRSPLGRWCRACSEPIRGDDPVGLSEGVCQPCRES
jgi:hypothetical protein